MESVNKYKYIRDGGPTMNSYNQDKKLTNINPDISLEEIIENAEREVRNSSANGIFSSFDRVYKLLDDAIGIDT